jgi:tight adherence protein B
MELAVAIFVFCLVAILGLYWALIVLPEDRQARAVTDRLGRPDQPRAASATGVAAPDVRQARVPIIEALLARHRGLATTLDRLVLEAGLSLSAGTVLALSLASGVAVALVTLLALRQPLIALLLGALASALPYAVITRKRNQRLRIFEEQFPEAIDLVARALRAGHAFTTGLSIAADEMPAPVGPEFRRVYDEQNFGLSMSDALRGMARRVPVLDARFFVTAVLTQRESGGNLAEVLDNLSAVMRDRFKVKRQIRVISAHGRISGLVLSLVPPGLAAFLYVLQPGFIRILIDDPLGVRLVVIAIVLQVAGTYIISRLVRIEY